ncbi:hypothetical protein J4227_05810 [Candidatus Woesearchaeota archaeon]|nr:hypothetical protein [Candidatus Woesearchaeota archaeon]
MEDIAAYMKRELVKYIKQERERGVPPEKIRKALTDAGHHHNLVEEAIDSLHRHKWDVIKAMDEPYKGPVQKELFFDVLNSLVRYIEYSISQGKSIHEIEAILLEYGHSQDAINTAMETVMLRREPISETAESGNGLITVRGMVIGISVLAFVVLLFILSATTATSLFRVFLGLTPTILTLVVSISMVERLHVKSFLAVLPFAFVMIFVFVGAFGGFPIFEGMDIKTLAVINLLISLFYVGIIIGADSIEAAEAFDSGKAEPKQSKGKEEEGEVPSEPEITIEDVAAGKVKESYY